ncbi:MAG: radical SAM family heme chaperone HemW [Clostridiales bacterium]|nr:radical SAM family heme chaperone HemW [Clostridiales bacterium]
MMESNFKVRKAGIYVHIPFCVQKCNYCAFLSAPASEEVRLKYVEALLQEIYLYSAGKKAIEADSIYFGGGTPSLLTPEQIEAIIYKIRETFAVTGDAEITLEANPGTLGEDERAIFDKLLKLKQAGVNRLSLGVQSMNDKTLKTLGRIHSSADVIRDIEIARKAGFNNISMDIIISIPRVYTDSPMAQTTEEISITDIKKIIGLEPEHISCYSLQLEEGTTFYQMAEQGLLKEVSDIEDRSTYQEICKILKQNGYEHYEISNFARKKSAKDIDFRSRHNSKYWNMSDYVGLGVGASGFLKGRRYKNVSSIDKYISSILEGRKPIEETYINTEHDSISESVFTGLRRKEGIAYEEAVCFLRSDNPKIIENIKNNSETVFWQYYDDARKEAEEFEANGYLVIDREGIRFTESGIDISNKIMALFV